MSSISADAGAPRFPARLRMCAAGLAVLGTAVTFSPALAQDTSWSGVYAGVHPGHGTAAWDGLLYSTTFIDSPEYGFDPNQVTIAGSGWLGGFHIGVNQQFDSFVVGLEMDTTWPWIGASGAFVNMPESHQWDLDNSIDWLGTARLRLGFAAGDFLFYGTGGLAAARTSSFLEVTHLSPPGGPVQSATGAATENHIGYAFGTGVEWQVTPNLSLRGEYLYANLGAADYNLHGTVTSTGAPHLTDAFPADLTVHTFRVGVSFLFGNR